MNFKDKAVRVASTLHPGNAEPFRKLADALPQLVWTATSDGVVRYYNARASEYRGIEENSDEGWNWQPVVHPDDLEETKRAWSRAVNGSQRIYECEHRVRMADGSYRWHLSRAVPVPDPEIGQLHWYGTATDIEELRDARQARTESEMRFQVMADSAPVMIWMAGTDMLFEWFNKGWLAYTGRTLEQELAMGWAEGVHPADRDRCRDVYTSSFATRQAFELEYRLRRHDGSYGWVLDKAVPRFAPDETFQGYIGSCIDITERKRSDEVRSLLAAIVSSSGDAILSLSIEGVVMTWNHAAERLFGYSEAEAIGREAGFLVPPHLTTEQALIYEDIRAGRQVGFDTLRLHKNGTLIPVSLGAAPLRSADGSIVGLTSTVRDITDRKALEERQTLLNRELSHRVKNTLAVIQSMARHTLRNSPGPAEFIRAFEGRLQSLATSHNILTASDWKGVDLQQLLIEQIEPLLDNRYDRLGLSGPKIVVHPEAATSIGLAMHELATNAAKYGALSNSTGRINLSWMIETGGAGESICFAWEERGGPPVVPPDKAGFGSVLLAMTDKGFVADYRPEGFCCVLTFILQPTQQKPRKSGGRPRRAASS